MIEFDSIKGGSILAIAGPLKHLHFICSDPFFNKDTGAVSVVAVNISSVKEGRPYDNTCMLDKGDHPFIRHLSYVYYKEAVIFRVEKIKYGIEAGDIKVLEKATEPVINRVISGFFKSKFTSRKIIKALELGGVRK